MRITRRMAGLAVAATAATSWLTVANPAQAQPTIGAAHATMHSCAAPVAGTASCHAVVRTDLTPLKGGVTPNATPSGYGPADLQSAYKLPSSTAGSGQTIAIVDAFDDPTAESDLGVYRSQYGLPPCTTANGCFRKVDQNGGTTYPRKDGGWAQEISLDLDMASAICPNCKILLVEAKTNSFANLGAAENEAAKLGANVISNSYGGSDASDANYGSYYNHPGIAITVSSGDNGYGVEYPASSHYVTAVGGTSLTRSSNTRGWNETVWSGAGSGCSAYNTALSGQASVGTGCAKRAVADVSAVADPNTGVAVYDSTAYQGLSGWLVFGGTSVSAPVIAGVYALAGNTASIDNNYPYSHASSLFDITSGSNGSCPTTQWCTARTGWDGPTGLGTPNGSGAF
ncbi:peptidase S8 [Micromonospora globispora]|uniref:Peptidase S8 n=2 Tax=Micromonospora globispora TaxID=1450148 RepID=A0A317JRW3_9ACTN|nr:S53 family peptidase [Micromonospora globispora]PWU43571.1 peptidase S8 [Micromonospora globispora]RQW99492.1 peptidase S8 [Micromonospora globispora]